MSKYEDTLARVWWEPHYRLQVRLPFATPTNASDSKHYSARSSMVRKLSKAFSVLVPDRLRPEQPLRRAAVTCTRFSSVRPDFDGLVHSFKYVLDCTHARRAKGGSNQGHAGGAGRAHIGGRRSILLDDRWSVIGQPRYEWKAVPKQQATFVEIIIEDRPPWAIQYR